MSSPYDTSLVATGFGGDSAGIGAGFPDSAAGEIAVRDRTIDTLHEENATLKSQLELAQDMYHSVLAEKKTLTDQNKTLLR